MDNVQTPIIPGDMHRGHNPTQWNGKLLVAMSSMRFLAYQILRKFAVKGKSKSLILPVISINLLETKRFLNTI
jgi:hypothetical protein